MELLRKRRRATEGVRGHVVSVWLSQPKGAEGLKAAVIVRKSGRLMLHRTNEG